MNCLYNIEVLLLTLNTLKYIKSPNIQFIIFCKSIYIFYFKRVPYFISLKNYYYLYKAVVAMCERMIDIIIAALTKTDQDFCCLFPSVIIFASLELENKDFI